MHEALLDEALQALDGDDDEALRIYADWLTEQGDPRGELIQLQLLPATPERDERQQQLLSAHGEAWLGEAASMLTQITWKRGFPHEATLSYALSRRPETLQTLRILHCKRGDRLHRAQTHQLLVHPVLHQLLHVDGPVGLPTIEAWLDDEPRPLAHLQVPVELLRAASSLRQRLRSEHGLPALKSLERREASHPRQWQQLLRTALGAQIERLVVRCQVATLPAWLGAFPDRTLDLKVANQTLAFVRSPDQLTVDASLGRIYDGGTSVSTAALLARVFAVLPSDRFDTLEVNWPRAYRPTADDRSALTEQIDRLRR